jgi:hypothetical protein
MMDTPAIATSTYGSDARVFGLDAIKGAVAANNLANFANKGAALGQIIPPHNAQFQQEKKPMNTRRLVKVIIVDPNDNVPLEDCVLYSGDEKMTDATDQELFFEIDIKSILDAHNAKRVKLIDKKVKERTENLEPAKIRDLKMVVVNVAAF